MYKVIFSLVALLALSACHATETASVAPTKPTRIKTIGVVSLVGDAVVATTTGLIGFGDDTDRAFLPTWRLKDLLVATAAARLSPPYTVVPVEFDDPAYRQFVDPAVKPSPAALIKGLRAGLERNNSADAYLVVVPDTLRDPIARTSTEVSGLGIYHRMMAIGGDEAYPYVFCELVLIDGHSFRTISSTPMKIAPAQSFNQTGYPVVQMRGFEWHPKFAQMTPAEGKQFYDVLRSLLIDSMTYSLAELELTRR